MTTSPATLRDLSAYWQSKGGINLGVVGDMRHCQGYHLGRDRIYGDCACQPKAQCIPGKGDDDYSVTHPRDKAGLTNAASAIDLGRLNALLTELYAFSRWLVARCQGNAPGTEDIREVIYSPEGETVQRYSGIDGHIHTGPGNGDASHITHTHVSYFRDSEKRDKRGVFAPYFALPDTGTEDDMEFEAKHERWLLDGGPGKVTTVGAPFGADGKVDYTRRLALTSGAGDTNRRYRLVSRGRLSGYDGSLDDPLYRALASYRLPDGDDAYNAGLDAAASAVAAVARR